MNLTRQKKNYSNSLSFCKIASEHSYFLLQNKKKLFSPP